MTFWIICAILSGLGIAFLLRPLLHSTNRHSGSNDIEVAIHRDQLKEIEHDLERNLINANTQFIPKGESSEQTFKISSNLLEEIPLKKSKELQEALAAMTKLHK